MTGQESVIVRLRRVMYRVLVALVVGFAFVFLAAPGSRESLLVEDGPLEWATVAVFAAAAITGTWAMRRNVEAPRLFWIVPGFAVIGFLDELSFGARLFGFGLPEVDGVEVDSLHDVFDLADRALAEVGIGRTRAAVTIAVAVIVVAAVLAVTGRLRRLVVWVSDRPPLVLLGGAVALLVLAVIVDQLGSSNRARFVEETLELVAAGTVLLGGLAVADAPAPALSDVS